MQVASLANSIYDEKMSTREGVDAKALKHSPSSSIVMATHSTSSNIIQTKGGNQRGSSLPPGDDSMHVTWKTDASLALNGPDGTNGKKAEKITYPNEVLESVRGVSVPSLFSDHNGNSVEVEGATSKEPALKKTKVSVNNDNTGAMIPTHLSTDLDIEELVQTVAMVIASVIRDSWHLDGLSLSHQCLDTNTTNNHNSTGKMMQNGLTTAASTESADLNCVSPAAIARGNHTTSSGTNTWNGNMQASRFKSDIASAVEHFAAKIFCPHLTSSKSRMGSASPRSDRVMISTFLAIQEMLLTNAINQFPSSPMRVHECVDAVLRASAKRLTVVSRVFSVEAFVQASQAYRSPRADFMFALMEADARSVGVLLDEDSTHQKTRCSQEENIIKNSSFNYTRLSHPLTGNPKTVSSQSGLPQSTDDKFSSLRVPSPNVCATFWIKDHSLSNEATKQSSYT